MTTSNDLATDTALAAAAPAASAERMVTITREFNAPRELVFQAWTDPEHLVRWYAPEGCTIVFHKLDLQPGGSYHHTVLNPVRDCTCAGVYREVVAPERVVFTQFFADADGRFITPAEAGMDPAWPAEAVVTLTFTERDGRTTVTLDQTVPETLATSVGALAGWFSMLDRLAGLLESR